MKILIVGCGNYGKVYLSYIRQLGIDEVVGFLDDDLSKVGQEIEGIRVLGTRNEFAEMKKQGVEGVIAPLGVNKDRVEVLMKARNEGLLTPNFIHPTAIISNDLRIGNGVYILPGCIIMPYVEIEDYVMISMGVKVAHHTKLMRGVFLSTGVNIGAKMIVQENVFVGIGATVMTDVKVVGANSIVGAGAVVIRDVAEGITVVGVPAKPIAN